MGNQGIPSPSQANCEPKTPFLLKIDQFPINDTLFLQVPPLILRLSPLISIPYRYPAGSTLPFIIIHSGTCTFLADFLAVLPTFQE